MRATEGDSNVSLITMKARLSAALVQATLKTLFLLMAWLID